MTTPAMTTPASAHPHRTPAPQLPAAAIRIGHGYDLHRLDALRPAGEGRPMILGNVPIENVDFGPVGHSDGDVLLHAITDALLGALCEPDIGELFPDTAPENDGQDSAVFLRAALERVHAQGYAIGNLDCTIIAQRPKIKPIKQAIRERLAELLELDISAINVKGKTHEGVDAVGEGRAIEVHVAALLFAGQTQAAGGQAEGKAGGNTK